MFLRNLIFLSVLATAAVGSAQDSPRYTEYLGEIILDEPVLPLATDEFGHLFYGTFAGPSSNVGMIEDPESQIDEPSATRALIWAFPEFPALRGIQSLQVTSDNDLLVAGDTGESLMSNIWRLDTDGQPTAPTYTLNITFLANSSLNPARRSAVSIYSDNGSDGVLIANGLNNMDFFDFNGTHLSGPHRVSNNYMRESVYNSQDNVFYVIRNGNGMETLIRNYVTNVDPFAPNGGVLTTSTLIADGGSNGNFGGARQNAYYYEAENQLITLDGDVMEGGNGPLIPPAVRVWDILDSGTSLSLAYRIDETTETTKFTSLGDAVVIGDKLYVSSSGKGRIYVYGPAPSSVENWGRFEAYVRPEEY